MTYIGQDNDIKGYLFMTDRNTIVTAATAAFWWKVFSCCKTSKDNRGDVPIWDDEPDESEFNILSEDDDVNVPHQGFRCDVRQQDQPSLEEADLSEDDQNAGPSLKDLQEMSHLGANRHQIVELTEGQTDVDTLRQILSPCPGTVPLPQTLALQRRFAELPPPGSPPESPTSVWKGKEQEGVPLRPAPPVLGRKPPALWGPPPWVPAGNPPAQTGLSLPIQDALRCRGRDQQPAIRPDDVYRTCNPGETDRLTEEEWWKLMDYPDSSGPPAASSSYYSGELAAHLSQEGGVAFINFLLIMAAPPNESSLLPSSNVWEWQLKDIMCMNLQDKKEWKVACNEELDSLKKRNVFELVDLPKGCKAVRNRWTFNIKTDGREKAQLVAKGFSQIEGIDFNEIFSPVVHFETVRIMLALAALNNWHISALDVKMAFLYGHLDEEIYLDQPQGFIAKGQKTKVWHLKHALYRLKQLALAWWKELESSMKKLGFKCCYADAGVFIHKH